MCVVDVWGWEVGVVASWTSVRWTSVRWTSVRWTSLRWTSVGLSCTRCSSWGCIYLSFTHVLFVSGGGGGVMLSTTMLDRKTASLFSN